jgi:hypothetical protein
MMPRVPSIGSTIRRMGQSAFAGAFGEDLAPFLAVLVFESFSHQHQRCCFRPLSAEVLEQRLDERIDLVNRVGGRVPVDVRQPGLRAAADHRIANDPLKIEQACEDVVVIEHHGAWAVAGVGSPNSGRHEPGRLEAFDILGRFAQSDELHRQVQLVLDRENEPRLGRAVELGDEQRGDVDRLLEVPGLLDRVLPRRGIEHQQHLVWRAVDALGDHIPDLRQLAHQVLLRVQSSGRIDDQHIDAARLGRFARVIRDRRRVGAGLVLHDLDAIALGPDRKLLHRRGAEGVAGAQHDLLVHLVLQQPRELCNGRGLARAVDSGDEDYRRPGARRQQAQLAILCREHADELLAHDGFCLICIPDAPQPPALPHLRDELFRPRQADIGADELLLQLREERIIDLPPGNEQRPDVGIEHRRRLLEGALELVDGFGEEAHWGKSE